MQDSNRYIFKDLDWETYQKFARTYSACKRFGFRGIVGWASGVGVKDVGVEILKRGFRLNQKEKISFLRLKCLLRVIKLK